MSELNHDACGRPWSWHIKTGECPPLTIAGGTEVRWCPKMLREKLCVQASVAPDTFTAAVIGRLIAVLDLHRPLGRDGKHGNLHTPTCGCEDK